MMKSHTLSYCFRLGTIALASIAVTTTAVAQDNLLPRPAWMQISKGYFKTDSSLLFGKQNQKEIQFQIDPSFDKSKPEGYVLVVNKSGVVLRAGTEAGLFYGKQTLKQLLTQQGLPYVTIQDYPRFGYRGLHVDVSRHFFPKEEILKLIDVMSDYKLNRLHLHLTDNGGWRLQIDKYPKLTTDAAYRPSSDYPNWAYKGPSVFVSKDTPGAYGGFYTKADVREMVAYAAARHITIIPEIEFPDHSSEVFAAYPELSCSGEKYGKGNSAFCIGNEKSIQFMKDVLAEVVELFPSEYIHVGGDEAYMESWKKCEKCQAFMKREGMKNVEELQSYMIKQCEAFLKTKGRKLIGWDEILKGGLAPEATVMSWRGVDGGIAAARMNHDVIMTPSSYCYFDNYQADPYTQPFAIGGYLPVRGVYSYDPVPADSLTPGQCQRIIGVQGNTWSEFIPTSSHLEYMMFPRALAIAEIGWTPQNLRLWDNFKVRMDHQVTSLLKRGVNAFPNPNSVEIVTEVNASKQIMKVKLEPEREPAEIHYTLDGTTPTESSPTYKHSISVQDSAFVVAAIFKDGKMEGDKESSRVYNHKAIGKPVQYYIRDVKYSAEGMTTLTNGNRGGMFYLDGKWQGFSGDFDCSVDLGATTDIHSVSATWMRRFEQGVFEPVSVELLTSDDGVHFKSQGVIESGLSKESPTQAFLRGLLNGAAAGRLDEKDSPNTFVSEFKGNWKARYVRLKAKKLAFWADGDNYLFTDEIVVW